MRTFVNALKTKYILGLIDKLQTDFTFLYVLAFNVSHASEQHHKKKQNSLPCWGVLKGFQAFLYSWEKEIVYILKEITNESALYAICRYDSSLNAIIQV